MTMTLLLCKGRLIIFLLGLCLVTCTKSAETKNILYYGWFIDEVPAESLRSITTSYFNECLEKSPLFKSFIESALQNTSLSNPAEFYTKPLDPNTQAPDPFYHVTAKFCGGTDNCSPYSDLEEVANSTEQEFTMELIGLFFTNRTYGIRVKLSAEQEMLYKPDGEVNYKDDFDHYKRNSEAEKSFQEYPGIDFEDQDLDFNPSQSKAHITLGCAPTIPAQVTGDDLGKIVEMENDIDFKRENITLDRAVVVHYGEWDAFVIYPDRKMKTKAEFKPYYSSDGNHNVNVNSFTILLSVLGFSWKLYYL